MKDAVNVPTSSNMETNMGHGRHGKPTWKDPNESERIGTNRPVGIEAPPERSARLHSQTKVHSVAPSPDHDHPRALLGVACFIQQNVKRKNR